MRAVMEAYRDALRLVLLTGQRPGEVVGIRAEEVDIAKAIWRIPASRVKNKRDHIVPLTSSTLFLLEPLLKGQQSGPLMRTPRGHAATNVSLSKAFSSLRARGFLQDVKATPHDLRRTAATLMGRLDIDQMTIARVLNHVSTTKPTVTGSTYDRYTYEPQMRRALAALDAHIRYIVGADPTAGNVVTLAGHRQ